MRYTAARLCVLSTVDLRFLRHVVERLETQKLHVYQPGSRRAAAALILRFSDEDQRAVHKARQSWETYRKIGDARTSISDSERARHADREGSSSRIRGLGDLMMPSTSTSTRATAAPPPSQAPHSPTLDFLNFLENRVGTSDAKPSSLKLLFMKRADRVASRWSGQIAFPGGQRDAEEDADDLHTVQREVYEELGMPLENTREFVPLGRMRDCTLLSNSLTGFGGARSVALSASSTAAVQGVVQAQFVYLHVGDLTPSVRLARHEVESVQWMPISRLSPDFVSPDSICHALSSFVHTADADKRLVLSEFFNGAMLAFPSISMPAPDVLSPLSSPSESSAGRTPRGSWRVWGQTLRSASALMMLDDRPAIDWPLFSAKNSATLQIFVVNAVHGYYEVCLAVHRMRAAWRYRRWLPSRHTAKATGHTAQHVYWQGTGPQRRNLLLPTGANPILYAVPETLNPVHIGCFFLDVFLVVWCAYLVAALIFTVTTAVRMALGWQDDESDAEKRRLAYHATQIPPSVEKTRRAFAAQRRETTVGESHRDGRCSDANHHPLASQPEAGQEESTTVGSDEALALALSEGENATQASASTVRPPSSTSSTASARADRGDRHDSTTTVVQLGFAHSLFLVSVVLFVWHLLKAMARIDWLGTFETDEVLLARVERESREKARSSRSRASSVESPSVVRSTDPVTWHQYLGNALDRALCALRVERAESRLLFNHFKQSVKARAKASEEEVLRGGPVVVDTPLLPEAGPTAAHRVRASSEDADAGVSGWCLALLRASEDALNDLVARVVVWYDDFSPHEVTTRITRGVTDRLLCVCHGGRCTNERLLARAWLYQNKQPDPPRQDWQPLGLSSRRKEEKAVDAERRCIAQVEAWLADHPTWPGAAALLVALAEFAQREPDFNVWEWARHSEAAKRRPGGQSISENQLYEVLDFEEE